MRTTSSSIRRPKDETGGAFSQAPDSFMETAKSLARFLESVATSRSLSKAASTWGLSTFDGHWPGILEVDDYGPFSIPVGHPQLLGGRYYAAQVARSVRRGSYNQHQKPERQTVQALCCVVNPETTKSSR